MFPDDKAYVNLLLMCFDDGIIKDISEGVSDIYEYNKYIKKLCDNFGCRKVIARRVVTDLFRSFGDLYQAGEYEVIEYIENGIVIPEAYYKNEKIKKVLVPDGVNTIGREAFCDCINLKEIYLPEGLEQIDDDAFSGCENLKRINIPKSVKSIGIHAFENCTNLISIVLPEMIDKINEGVFLGCENLEKIDIPNGVIEICDYAFCDCYSLKAVNIPYGVKRIGVCSFENCENINSINIPDSVDEIGDSAFYCDDDGLKSVTSLYDIRFVGNDAFPDHTQIGKITISKSFMDRVGSINEIFGGYYYPEVETIIVEEGVIKIPEEYFAGLKCVNVVLPDSLLEIDKNAFEDAEISHILMPNKVAYIGEEAFSHCSITEIILPGSLKKICRYTFYCCEKLKKVIFEDGIEVISDCAFDDCVNLQAVRLPKTLKLIADSAFYCCHKLGDLKIPDGAIECSGKYIEEQGWDVDGLYRIQNDILVEVDEDVLFDNPGKIINIYSLNKNIMYDYIIMDEASQVDIVTGSLALSCAKNAIIVGDMMQLPNVVKREDRDKADSIFKKYSISEGYRYTKSFLESVLEVIPNIECTLLREHYRCHPKIINFCNQRFYNNELIVMTEDNGEKNVIVAYKTAKGNHARGKYSERQVDVIKNEVIPNYAQDKENTGIITPYRNQVNTLRDSLNGYEVDTVHKFQGREKDTIVLSTVDDEITDFVDDPNLINVAVSRAKKRLILVTSGNEQRLDSNVAALIDYIEYNNFELHNSKVNSVFDYLYKQYDDKRVAYLEKHKRVSEYDSENLMYILLKEILRDEKYGIL